MIKVGKYTFLDIRSFPGMEYPGYTVTIAVSRDRFATFTDYGNGGEPELRPSFILGDIRNERWKAMTKEFIAFAEAHVQKRPACLELGVPEHDGDTELFIITALAWNDIEGKVRQYLRRYPGLKYTGVLLRDGIPEAISMLSENNIRKAAKTLLQGEKDISNLSIALMPLPAWNFRDGLVFGTPARELIGELHG